MQNGTNVIITEIEKEKIYVLLAAKGLRGTDSGNSVIFGPAYFFTYEMSPKAAFTIAKCFGYFHLKQPGNIS